MAICWVKWCRSESRTFICALQLYGKEGGLKMRCHWLRGHEKFDNTVVVTPAYPSGHFQRLQGNGLIVQNCNMRMDVSHRLFWNLVSSLNLNSSVLVNITSIVVLTRDSSPLSQKIGNFPEPLHLFINFISKIQFNIILPWTSWSAVLPSNYTLKPIPL
jgi:hypothetical protein